MDRFTILLAGELRLTERLRRQIAGSRIIAADAGILHAEVLGLHPELWVGDFDSAPADALDRNRHVPREAYPSDKDRSDGELALDAALARGARQLLLAGGLGGQTDHAMAHILLAVRLAQLGLRVLVTSGGEEAHPVLAGTTEIALPRGSRVSILALGELRALTLQGVQWPLQDAFVPIGSSWTLSNVAQGPVLITLGAGQAVAIAYPADD